MSKDSKNTNPEENLPKDIASKIKNLEERRANTKFGGGKERQESQKSKGKKLARERMSLLFDNSEFTEIDPYVKHFSNDFGLSLIHI